METITYRTNRFLGFVITVMGFALIFSVDIDRLLIFYKDPWGILIVSFFAFINPLLFLFGFALKVSSDEAISTNFFFFKKKFKIDVISHVLYQPTWAGLMSQDSKTNMRSLHVVRNSGGWRETISLANGFFREEELADIARRLQKMNPRIALDEHTTDLIKKYGH